MPYLTCPAVPAYSQIRLNVRFAHWQSHRLGAADTTPPRPGLSAMQRGSLLHRALEQFWQDIVDHAALVALSDTALAQRIRQSVDHALHELTSRYRLSLSRSGHDLERGRLCRLLDNWLALEKQREPFTVIDNEHPITMQFAGMTLNGKIDRIDELADGSTLLIDYKSGKAGKKTAGCRATV